MRDIVIVGTGALGAALVECLRDTGVTVILADRVTPFADVPPLDLVGVVRELAEVEPPPRPAVLVERWPRQVQARPPARWFPRPREQRTRGKR